MTYRSKSAILTSDRDRLRDQLTWAADDNILIGDVPVNDNGYYQLPLPLVILSDAGRTQYKHTGCTSYSFFSVRIEVVIEDHGIDPQELVTDLHDKMADVATALEGWTGAAGVTITKIIDEPAVEKPTWSRLIEDRIVQIPLPYQKGAILIEHDITDTV